MSFNKLSHIFKASKFFTTQISNSNSSISQKELDKFSKLASDWWNYNGHFKPLHSMNLIRCNFIRESTCNYFKINNDKLKPFTNLKILDIGCGGGILSEPLCRLGANVLGIDLVEESIQAARHHASRYPEFKNVLRYELKSAESLISEIKENSNKFDIVVASEVIEHVDNIMSFVKTLSALLKDNGMLFISTVSRTPLSYLLVILIAEKIGRIVPNDTHEWRKFVTPGELALIAKREDLEMYHLSGMSYNPVNNKWHYQKSTSVNFIASFVKK